MHDKFFEIDRTNMVTSQILTNNVRNQKLISSISTTKKELFIPDEFFDIVYSDSDIEFSGKRKLIRTFILAKMFEKCNFLKDDSVLIIGCLSGYSMALISNMVNYVFGIENDKILVDKANKTLSHLNFHNCSVFFKKNLSSGLSKNAPYDKIFIEGSVNFIPDDLLRQLKDDGEIFTVLENNDRNIGEFVRGVKIDSSLSFSSFFNTSVNLLPDFIIEENDYEKTF